MLDFTLEGGGSCPEQYDVYLGREIVAYLRLRHGNFTAECPDVGGELVYESQTVGDGGFLECEREKEIDAALEKVEIWVINKIKKELENAGLKVLKFN